jgi:hypothetical protein
MTIMFIRPGWYRAIPVAHGLTGLNDGHLSIASCPQHQVFLFSKSTHMIYIAFGI